MFLPGRRGIIAAALLGLALEPKLLLLAPIWAAGVLLYRWKRPNRMSEPLAWALALGSLLGIWLFHQAGVTAFVAQAVREVIGEYLYVQLAYSKFFLADWLLGLLVFVNFAAMRVVTPRLAPVLLAIERPVRLLAGYTLTLYLLHQPLMLFWAAVLHGDPNGYGYWWAITALVALSIALIGHVTEQRRGGLKRWLEMLFVKAQSRFEQGRPAPTGF